MENIIQVVWQARGALLTGFWLTVGVAFLSIVLGTLLGMLVGLSLTYSGRILRSVARLYTDILRGIPVLVLLLAAFYVPAIVGVNLTATQAGVFGLSLFCASHVGEVVRGALQAVPQGQMDAGRAIGLTFRQRLLFVLLPQALRQMIPTWTNAAVEIVKATTLLSIIGAPELIMRTQEVIGRTFLTMPLYVVCGIFYLLLDYSLERFGKYVDRRLA